MRSEITRSAWRLAGIDLVATVGNQRHFIRDSVHTLISRVLETTAALRIRYNLIMSAKRWLDLR